MSLKTKILLLAILPLILVTSAITLISVKQSRNLSEVEIHTFEENLLASKRSELKNYLSLALTSIAHIMADTQMSNAAAQHEVKRILNDLTYDADGYFFVYDQQGVNLVHPKLQSLVGKNLYDMQDSNGVYVIRRLLEIATDGGGFLRYVWNKPSTNKEERKISYAVQLPRWNWMLGTGLYIDDISHEVAKIRGEVKDNIQNTFFTILLIIAITVIMTAIIGIAINIHESRLADTRLRELAHKSVLFQVSERRRFARELHDGINQLMVSVKYRIELAMGKIDKQQNALADLDKGNAVLAQAIQEVRRISHDLRPSLLDDLGLEHALQSLFDLFQERTGIEAKFQLELPEERLPEDIEITFYRIIQEALTNTERHSEATQVNLRIWRQGDMVWLKLRDNGQGFDLQERIAQEGIGLRNMRERIELFGGEFKLKSSHNQGTQLRAGLSLE